MGRYYNPVSDITDGNIGRSVPYTENFNDAMRSVGDNEYLYALCDKGLFKQAVWLFDQSEWDEFFNQYKIGMLLSFRLYILSEENHSKAH